MGMFDELRCHYPLPIEGTNGLLFQTKDTDAQFLDLYEIREDGTLWHETYDIENKSQPNAEGVVSIAGSLLRVNKQWKREHVTGEIRFYATSGSDDSGWLEFSAHFVDGHLKQLHTIEHRTPNL